MEYPLVITLSREFGSGGHEIGEKLAQELGIPCYDKKKIAETAKEMGLDSSIFDEMDEAPPTPTFFSSLASGMLLNLWHAAESPLDAPRLAEQMFSVQTTTIKAIAQKGSCLIIGRCSDYILANYPNCINLYVYANLAQRVDRIAKLYDIPQEKARNLIEKSDKDRANHYNYYTDREWGKVENYNLCLDSSIGIDNSVKVCRAFVDVHEEK